ncbi:RING-type E3 ubiquitin transferase [Sarracenia purpurea var. burkii]
MQQFECRNGGIKSHVIMDFVMKRLNLDDDEEIELCCFGEPIMKTLTLTEVVDIWKNCMATTPPDYRRSRPGLKLGDRDMPMMHITYKRRFAPPFSPNISGQSTS